MSHAMQGHPRWKGHSEILTKYGPLKEGWETIPVFLLREPHEQYVKAKNIGHWKMSNPGKKISKLILGKWREFINSSRKNDVAGPKQKWSLVMDVSDNERKIWCCKEEYYIGIWNVMSMKQGKLEVVKQEMLRVSINILDISELK